MIVIFYRRVSLDTGAVPAHASPSTIPAEPPWTLPGTAEQAAKADPDQPTRGRAAAAAAGGGAAADDVPIAALPPTGGGGGAAPEAPAGDAGGAVSLSPPAPSEPTPVGKRLEAAEEAAAAATVAGGQSHPAPPHAPAATQAVAKSGAAASPTGPPTPGRYGHVTRAHVHPVPHYDASISVMNLCMAPPCVLLLLRMHTDRHC